jgi:hypothetical protein
MIDREPLIREARSGRHTRLRLSVPHRPAHALAGHQKACRVQQTDASLVSGIRHLGNVG